MGPSKLFHKDRSQQSLLNTQEVSDRRPYHASPKDSPLHSPGFPPTSAPHPYDDEFDDDDDDSRDLPSRSEEAQYYQQQPSRAYQPTRSLSQRGPGHINTNQPTINLVRATSGATSTPASAIEPEEPDRYYYQRAEPVPPVQKEDRRQKRRFFGLGSSKEHKEPVAPTNRLGRSRSIRGKDQLPEEQQRHPLQQHSQQYPQQHQHQHQHPHQHPHHHPLHWGGHVSPTDDDEDEEEHGGAGLHTSHQSGSNPPGLPDKDPLRSPGFPPSVSTQEYYGKGGKSPLDRQGSHPSPWERGAYHAQQHNQPEPGPAVTYHPYGAQSKSAHESLNQHWQEQDSRPSSRQSLEPPQSTTSHPYSHHTRASSSQASSVSHMPLSMGPGQIQAPQPPSRRSSEAQQAGQPRDQLTYQPYSQGSVISPNPSSYNSGLAPQSQVYRPGQPSPMQAGEQGRSTPPPSRSRDDLSNLDVNSLVGRYDELQDKYRKVKKYYFDKDAQVQQLQSQVQQLQNALAHQRLSLSRTSLDDNEYCNRFNRLDGAINNLAFNLRREWRSIPPWLAPHANREALSQTTKEMTAVGRAMISRWLVEEVLDRYFHPAVEPVFSSQLKTVEKNLRRYASPTGMDEEKDALLSKISTWRLSTLDGMHDALATAQAGEYRASITALLIEKLIASLCMHLKEPPPPGLEGSVAMIIELAVGVAANIPLESRDVFVEYALPGQLLNENYMKVETGIPALTNPGEGPIDDGDTGSIDSRETGTSNGNGSDETPASSRPSEINQQTSPSAGPQGQGATGQKGDGGGQGPAPQQPPPKKKGMFSSIMGGGSSASSGSAGNIAASKKGSGPPQQQAAVQSQAGGSQPGQQAGVAPQAVLEKKEDRVRFSTFMAVEVRGKNVLIKAPVYLRD